jgi:hypothetical protein
MLPHEPIRNHIDVIVVVHGIGRPKPYETLQRFLMYCGEWSGFEGSRRPRYIAYESLGSLAGRFENGEPWFTSSDAPGYGFAEVHWADLMKGEDDPRALNILKWASHTGHVLKALESRKVGDGSGGSPLPTDIFARVVGDVVLTAQISRSLMSYARIEVDGLVDSVQHFVASYQVFTGSEPTRNDIVERCAETLDRIAVRAHELNANENGEEIRVHVVAHSLGSVIALLALMEVARRPGGSDRLGCLRSFCTLGSPLDLFVALHGELFDFESLAKVRRANGHRVDWVNYVEAADPVASSLVHVSKKLEEHDCTLFHDLNEHTYSHTLVPGGAHVAYWTDGRLWKSYWAHCIAGVATTTSWLRNRFGSWSSLMIACVAATMCFIAAWCCVAWAENYKLLYVSTSPGDQARADVAKFVGASLDVHMLPGKTFLALVVSLAVLIMGQVMCGSMLRAVSRFRWWHILAILVLTTSSWRFLEVHLTSKLNDSLLPVLFVCGAAVMSVVQVIGDRWLCWGRVVSFVCLFVVAVTINGIAVFNQSNDVPNIRSTALTGIALTGLIMLFWWFATLWMRLFIVWMEYVIGRRHIDVLAQRFQV